jgi:capsular polysaccharide biosynthesis protein
MFDDPLFEKIIFKTIYPASPFSKRIKHPPTKCPSTLEEGYVAVIPDGRVWGLNGAILAPDNNLLWDVSLEFVYPYSNHSIFKEEKLPPISQNYKRATDLTHTGAKNYYHWMYEVIPRLHLLKQSNIEADLFIIKSEPTPVPFQSETLDQIGIKTDQLIKTHKDFHIQVENLVIPSQPSFATKWAYDFLRKTFLIDDIVNPSDKKRIYISRKHSRIITNEDDLMYLLMKYGFIKIELETLPVAEQIKLFSSAEVIIAPHGAGLVNLTFCHPGTKILEIFSPTYITPLYWVISSFSNLNYYSYIGQTDPNQLAQGWSGFDNIKINMHNFIVILKNMRL